MGVWTRTIDLLRDFDVVLARQSAREMARDLGFSLMDQTRIATAVSEIARRLLIGRTRGTISLGAVRDGSREGFECICLGGDWPEAPSGIGSGEIFGGIARLMDEFHFRPQDRDGVPIVMRKWLRE